MILYEHFLESVLLFAVRICFLARAIRSPRVHVVHLSAMGRAARLGPCALVNARRPGLRPLGTLAHVLSRWGHSWGRIASAIATWGTLLWRLLIGDLYLWYSIYVCFYLTIKWEQVHVDYQSFNVFLFNVIYSEYIIQ